MLRAIMEQGLSCRLTASMMQFNFASVLSSSKRFHATPPRQDEFGIATRAEREELEWKQQGKVRFDLTPPQGPIGTKIVGCCRGVGEDEHDILWFHLEKGKIVECSICAQVF